MKSHGYSDVTKQLANRYRKQKIMLSDIIPKCLTHFIHEFN